MIGDSSDCIFAFTASLSRGDCGNSSWKSITCRPFFKNRWSRFSNVLNSIYCILVELYIRLWTYFKHSNAVDALKNKNRCTTSTLGHYWKQLGPSKFESSQHTPSGSLPYLNHCWTSRAALRINLLSHHHAVRENVWSITLCVWPLGINTTSISSNIPWYTK